ncbi:hypothetical protein P8452_04495 [Trifolium repens]|nr:hypothetical protein P8452_04495 [Trifolium repens]
MLLVPIIRISNISEYQFIERDTRQNGVVLLTWFALILFSGEIAGEPPSFQPGDLISHRRSNPSSDNIYL